MTSRTGGDRVGFVGLGVMGEPMARTLARAGTRLTVWNRTGGKDHALRALGATVAATPHEVFASCGTVILMLAHEEAMDQTLERGSARFASLVAGRTVVHMGTTAPRFSAGLARDVAAAGGRYVEAPVSGSRGPAEDGQLVAMLAGEEADLEHVRTVLDPMCRATFVCGAVPNGMLTKLAVNLFLIAMVTGLVESLVFARGAGLDLDLIAAILGAGPMASAVSRGKAAKLTAGDFAVQASVVDVAKNARLVAEAVREAGAAGPVIETCDALFREAVALGHGNLDMIGVLHAIEARSRG